MAIGLENYTNTAATSTAYPHGGIVDDAAGLVGTPINKETQDDIQQTFRRALVQAGITPNGLPDNVSNGYQYSRAFGLEAWSTGTAPTATVDNSPTGSCTIQSPGDITINKFCLHGKTLHWHLKLDTVTIAGAPTQIFLTPPASLTWANLTMRMFGWYNGTTPLIVSLEGPTTAGQITLKLQGGAAFTNGTNNQSFDICIVAEIV